jgi:hypothetical protein
MHTEITFFSLPCDRVSDELRAMLAWWRHEEISMVGNTAAYAELKLWQRRPPAVVIRRNGTPWVIASGPGAPTILAEALTHMNQENAA